MSIKHQELSNTSIGQSPGCDPKTSSKRSSGIFSFFKWFRPSTSRESVTQESSPSSSCDSLNSIASAGTIASFSFVLPTEYKPEVTERNIAPGPETDTYKARLKQRDNRRERDKNVTLRKKYNLFFSRETTLKTVKATEDEDNSKSLPLMTRKNIVPGGDEKLYRRTNSESSKLRKAGAYCHVKGKRKAPQPPVTTSKQSLDSKSCSPSTMSLRKKKRLAPQPPSVLTPNKVKTSISSIDKYETIEYADADVIYNDSLKLDHGILKSAKDKETSENSLLQETGCDKSPRASYIEAPPVSPRPWYKRNREKTPSKKDNTKEEERYEPISLYSNKSAENSKQSKKDDKRKSGMSFLTNISELDREASNIIRKEHEKDDDAPAFLRSKLDDTKNNTDTWTSPKRRSAKDLIAKFNAITNVTKVTVNSAFFGTRESNAFQKENSKRDYFGKPTSITEIPTKQNKTEVQPLEVDSSLLPNNKNKIPLIKSESSAVIFKHNNKPEYKDASVFDKKSWFCPKCSLENDYWRIICYVCSTIKPYFDDLTSPPAKNNTLEKNKTQISEINHNPLSTSDTSKNIAHQQASKPAGNVHLFERHLERSRTQIGFSALAKHNNGASQKNKQPFIKSSSVEEKPKQTANDKQEERERLKKMLIEMKNSLPKRRLNPTEKLAKRASVIEETTESTENKSENAMKIIENGVPEIPTAEVIVATRETIYENIKVKKTTDPNKPVKISSAVQTNSVTNKSPIKLAEALFNKQEEHRDYELMRPNDFAEIYSIKIEGAQQNPYINIGEINHPSKVDGAKSNFSINTDTLEVNRLLKRLEVAIAKGELNEASNLARELAQLKVNCSVVRQKSAGIISDTNNSTTRKTFVVDMYVEDKVSHRGPFPINVFADQNVLQLKTQIEQEFQIPIAVQRWIFGKELVTDDNTTLRDMKITNEGCPLFLYLVAPGKETHHNMVNQEPVENDLIKKDNTATTSNATGIIKQNHLEVLREVHNREVMKDKEKGSASKLNINQNDKDNKLQDILYKIPVEEDKLHFSSKSSKLNSSNSSKTNTQLEIDRDFIKDNLTMKELTPTVLNGMTTGAVHRVVTTTNVTPSFYLVNSKEEKQLETDELLVNLVIPDEVEDYDSKTLKPQKNLWECLMCTFLNPQNSNICSICSTIRKLNNKVAPQDHDRHYQQLINLDNADLVENIEAFECLICLSDILPHDGVTLRECLHQFCKPCLVHTIEFTEEAEVKCPYRDDEYSCDLALQDREIKALLTPVKYDQFLAKSVAQAENKIDKSFHCKTPDCKGWCIFEDNVNEFHCPVCRRTNCLTCQAIHIGLNCKQYQESINESTTDENAKRTKDMLEEMVNKGEAIKCPTCQVILMKKWGCDWLRCSMCKTEICWVTRGPRWGPAGKGDTSGGCRCGVNAIKCHPKCNYCH